MENYLTVDANSCYPTTWQGPYMAMVNADPWGRKYIMNANGFSGTGPIWILSAGPDGNVDTPSNNNSVVNDDIGLRLR